MAITTGKNPPKGGTNGRKSKELGPRVTVYVGEITVNKKKVKVYSNPLKSTAEYFGIKEAENPEGKSKNGIEYSIVGVQGNAIKIRTEQGRYKSFPMPQGMKIKDIKNFLKTNCTKNKPKAFVSPRGRTHSVPSK